MTVILKSHQQLYFSLEVTGMYVHSPLFYGHLTVLQLAVK